MIIIFLKVIHPRGFVAFYLGGHICGTLLYLESTEGKEKHVMDFFKRQIGQIFQILYFWTPKRDSEQDFKLL